MAKGLASMYKCEVELKSFAITWDGIVTNCHKKHVKKIEIDKKTKAFIQSTILKQTLRVLSLITDDKRRYEE